MDMSGDFLHDWDKFAARFANVYLARRWPSYKSRSAYLSNYNVWYQNHDRKDAKRQTMDFSTWYIVSKRKRVKYEPFF